MLEYAAFVNGLKHPFPFTHDYSSVERSMSFEIRFDSAQVRRIN